MRFVELIVESFQAIEHAKVELGPGLNILYGPNDLGKSTLATAIRAALLVLSKASEGQQFVPWYRDAVPRVSLTFVDDGGHWWRVKKGFGSGAGAGAELWHSKDGRDFTLDCKARQVDEKLRTMLAWGVATPGGKSAPRGLPQSFLTNALLAGQAEVDAVLSAGIDADQAESGRLRLTKALATLAQDPIFKRVLDVAQAEVDAFFTATGRRRSGQGSRLMQANEAVKKLSAERELLQAQLEQALATEQHANALRHRALEAKARWEAADAHLREVRRRFDGAKARRDVEARLAAAKQALAVIDGQAARVAELTKEVAALEAAVKREEGKAAAAAKKRDEAAGVLRAAEEALARSQSADGVRERELRRATLSGQLSELRAARATLEARKEKAVAVRAAAAEVTKLRGEKTRALERIAAIEKKHDAVAQEVNLARAILDFGRWKEAHAAAEDAGRASAGAEQARADAKAKTAEAGKASAAAKKLEAEIARAQEKLPSGTQLAALFELERELGLAEAALGGGFSVTVRPRSPLRLSVEVDDEEPVEEAKLRAERAFEAERTATITVGDLLEIEVAAGAKERRQQRDALKKRWKSEVLPLFTEAGVSTLRELQLRAEELAKKSEAAKAARAEEQRLLAEAKGLEQQAGLLEKQAAGADSIAELDKKKSRFDATQLELLERVLATLGADWESQQESAHRQKSADLKSLADELANAKSEAGLVEYRLADAEKRVGPEARAPDELVKAADAALASNTEELNKAQANLASLETEQGSEVAKARAGVETARRALDALVQEHAAAEQALDDARAALHGRLGEKAAFEAQLAQLDRPGAVAAVTEAEQALAPLAGLPAVSEADVASASAAFDQAKQDLDDANEEFHKADGALTKVGGPDVRERMQQLEEALASARARELELEIDSDAWRLLRDTLREAENAEGTHLGRALAAPVAQRFVELTGGRYKALELDANMRTTAVEVGAGTVSGDAVLGALSVGTRDQLATLIRLAIAKQLKSALVLDDHLVHTDPSRLDWFMDVLRQTALDAQVLVFTCRPQDYLRTEDLPKAGEAMRELAGGTVRAVDLTKIVTNWPERAARPAKEAK